MPSVMEGLLKQFRRASDQAQAEQLAADTPTNPLSLEQDPHQAIIRPSDTPSGNEAATNFYNAWNTLFPYRGTQPARPQAKIPGTNRNLDLMTLLGQVANTTPTGPGLNDAALLAPGWVQAEAYINGEFAKRNKTFLASISTPSGNAPIKARFRVHGPQASGVWELGWLGHTDPTAVNWQRSKTGSEISPQSNNLGPKGVISLIHNFRQGVPEAKWLTFHRVGGASAKMETDTAVGVDLRGDRPQFVHRRDGYREHSDPRYRRYVAFHEAMGNNSEQDAAFDPTQYNPPGEPSEWGSATAAQLGTEQPSQPTTGQPGFIRSVLARLGARTR